MKRNSPLFLPASAQAWRAVTWTVGLVGAWASAMVTVSSAKEPSTYEGSSRRVSVTVSGPSLRESGRGSTTIFVEATPAGKVTEKAEPSGAGGRGDRKSVV